MTDEVLVKQALAELGDVVRCRCHEAYKGRGLHDPDCQCDSAEALATVTKHIEALTEQLEAARADAKEAEAYAEELEKQLNICRMAQVVMENGIAQVEGEFARAMKHVMDYSNDRHLVAFARAALAEIEGERDE
jgi:CHASE3 domain sensor protein